MMQQKYPTSQPTGFSLVLAMGLVLMMSLIAIYLVEYMVPFSRQIKGVEHASQAYYESASGIESAVYEVYDNIIGYEPNFLPTSSLQTFAYTTVAEGNILPPVGEGGSEFDADWNRLGITEPIQLVVGKGRISNPFTLKIRVPDIDGNGSPDTLDTSSSEGMILWQISSNAASLSTSDTQLDDYTASDINGSAGISENIWTQQGETKFGATQSFQDFYTNNCVGISDECIIKISLIQPLLGSNNQLYPYLEYQIHSDDTIPLRFARITSIGISHGFRKTLQTNIPQDTTNSAFDFALFQ